MMDRRAFVVGRLAVLAAPLAADGQQAGKVYRIGWLAAGPIPDNLDACCSGLRALGYLNGHNVVIESRYAVGQRNRLPSLPPKSCRPIPT